MQNNQKIKIGMIAILIMAIPIISAKQGYHHFLTKPYADTLYCIQSDGCGGTTFKNSSNITVAGDQIFFNGTISGGGDNLGDHTATQNLDMGLYNITRLTQANMSIYHYRPYDEDHVVFENPNVNGDVYVRVNDGGTTIDALIIDSSATGCTVWSGSPRFGERIYMDHPDYSWAGITWSTIDSCQSYNVHFSIGEDTSEDQAIITVHSDIGNHLLLGVADYAFDDYDRPNRNDPWYYVFSDSDPDVVNTEWIGFAHNSSDAIIETGKGNLVLNPASGVVYVTENISYANAIDRTPGYDKSQSQALRELRQVKNKIKDGKQEIDHSTIPDFAYAKVKKIERYNCFKMCMDCRLQDCNSDYAYYDLPYLVQYDNISEIRCNEFCDEREIEEEGRNMGAMITMLTEAVKELADQNEELQSRIDQLENAK